MESIVENVGCSGDAQILHDNAINGAACKRFGLRANRELGVTED